jgi:hypothetical protein
MSKTSCLLIAVSVLLFSGLEAFPGSSIAGDIVDKATEAESLLAKDNGLDAYEKLREALAAINARVPLGIRKAFFVTEKPLIYGNYSRVKSNEFPVGSSLITYVEPVGLTWVNEPGNLVACQFTVDFELRNPNGEVLAVQKAFGSFKIESHEPLFEIYSPLTLDVSSVPAGDYVLKYSFNYANSKKTTSVEQKFKLK